MQASGKTSTKCRRARALRAVVVVFGEEAARARSLMAREVSALLLIASSCPLGVALLVLLASFFPPRVRSLSRHVGASVGTLACVLARCSSCVASHSLKEERALALFGRRDVPLEEDHNTSYISYV